LDAILLLVLVVLAPRRRGNVLDRPPRLSVVHVPAADAPSTRSNELLNLAPDARVLIVNCDDFGMCPPINAAVVQSIEEGIGTSCSLMVPCPGAAHAMQLLRARPEIPFGIHLTLVCDTEHDRWRPLAEKERVPSLLDDAGELFAPARVPELLARARPDEVELEFRAQIDAVVDAGLTPTHLDRHCLADGGRADIFDLTVGPRHHPPGGDRADRLRPPPANLASQSVAPDPRAC
jgi:chitin disaccharide deacetylase